MQMIGVESQNISEIGYDESESKLYVRFRDGSRLYCYMKVPAVVWLGFRLAKSTGRYFNEQIKGFFEYEEIRETDHVALG